MNESLISYVASRLPNRYLLQPKDAIWLDVCSRYAEGELTNTVVVAAVKRAVDEHGLRYHIDPYELLIDAQICDPDVKPLPEE